MDDDGVFWELTSSLESAEAVTRAHDELAGDRATFVDLLRRLPVGEVVTIVTLDGAELRGRVLHVGVDVVRLGEVRGTTGARARRVVRCHDIRVAAVSRLTWDANP